MEIKQKTNKNAYAFLLADKLNKLIYF